MSGRFWRVVGALALVGTLTGPLTARPAAAASARVVAANLQFTPARVQISVGDTVVWDAEDNEHTVTARDGSFDSSDRGLMGYGDEFRWRFRAPGTYPYYCRVHGDRGMQGVVVVVDPSSTTATTRAVPVSAAATTSTTVAGTTTTAPAATTTTTRPLATSSTTSIAMATPSTTLVGAPVDPQAPPALNPGAPVVGGSAALGQGLPTSDTASRRSSGPSTAAVAGGAALGALVVLGGVGGGLRRRARRRRRE